MIYQFIREHETRWPIEMMCEVLNVSRSGYYAWRKNPKGKRAENRESLQAKIKAEYFVAKCRYGSTRIAAELTRKERKISRTTVALHMKKMGLKCKLRGKYKITTDSSHKEPVAENILNREFNQREPSKAWVSDITYIRVKEGFICLTTVIDLF